MITKELIGKKIQQARIRNQLTQEELAEKIELSENYLSKVERGLNMLNSVKFLRIIDVLKINLEEFGINNQNILETKRTALSEIILNCDDETLKMITEIAKIIVNLKK